MSIFYIAILGLLWVVNLVNGTALNSVYHITEYTKYIVIIISTFLFIGRRKSNQGLIFEKKDIIFLGFMIYVFVGSSYFNGYGLQAIDYLWVFSIIFILSHMNLDENVFKWIGILYAIGGLFVLYVYDYGTILKGWNENSIAMIGTHSFLVMLIPLNNLSNRIHKLMVLAAAGIFSFFLSPTDSRSGMLFMIIGALFVLNILPKRIITGERNKKLLMLLTPLFIAVAVVLISKTSFAEFLNLWSYKQFQKPIFNGRDDIWLYGFRLLGKNPLFGTGNMNFNNWHNSAIVCLTAYGAIGYILWIGSFNHMLNKAQAWLEDYIVQGCIVSFVVLYLQQTVELGLISQSPSILAYVILGMMFGRIKYLNRCEEMGWYGETEG